MIKVTIEISEATALLLSGWASVSRTFDAAEKCCFDLIQSFDKGSSEYEYANNTSNELQDLHEPIENLHRAVREQLWARNR